MSQGKKNPMQSQQALDQSQTIGKIPMLLESKIYSGFFARFYAYRWNLTAVFLVLALGLLFTLANIRLPILRNSLIYARIAENLLEHDMKLWEVCGKPQLSYNKACGFSVVSAPLVWLFEANAGLKWATFLTTCLLLLVCLWFFQRFNPAFNLKSDIIWLEILMVFFNPLLVYQFWSGYSESLFAALFLLSFILLDILLKDSKFNAVGWSIAYASILLLVLMTKHHALLLFVLHPVYVYWHRDLVLNRLKTWDPQLLWLALGFSLAIGFVGLGVIGNNPLLTIQSNAGEYSQPIFYLENVRQFVIFLTLTFGVLLLAALPGLRISRTDAVFALLIILYTHVIMVYQGAAYNMRYYIPVMPLMALYIGRALNSLRRGLIKSVILSVFLLANLLTILIFNHSDSNVAFLKQLRRLPVNLEKDFDNLRMRNHIAVASSFEILNRTVPPNGTLYWLSNYYDDATYYTFQKSQLLRKDIEIIYLPEFDNIHPAQEDFFVFSYEYYPVGVNRALLERMFKNAQVTRLSSNVYRIHLQEHHSSTQRSP